MAEPKALSNRRDPIIFKKSIIVHYKKQTATVLLNIDCHREIPKQRSLDFAKACSRLLLISIRQYIIIFKTKGLVALITQLLLIGRW